MKRLFTLAAALVLIFGMALSAQAALVTITFDEEGINLGEMITDQYAAYGIHWDPAYVNVVSSGADFNNAFTSDGQIIWYDTKPARGSIQLDAMADYLSFDFRRASEDYSIFLALYDTSTGEDVLVWDFGAIGWSGDIWWTFTYDALFGTFDKIVMYSDKKFVIDNLSINMVNTVPVPASVLLLGTGLIPLILRRKKTSNVQ